MPLRQQIVLPLTEDEALAVHHSLSTTVGLMDQVGEQNIPDDAPLKGHRSNLVLVAQRLDHERRHKGAVPNPNGPCTCPTPGTVGTVRASCPTHGESA